MSSARKDKSPRSPEPDGVVRYAIVETAWGAFSLVARGGRLIETRLPQKGASAIRGIKERWPDAVESPKLLSSFQRQVIDYFAGRRTAFTVEIDLCGARPFRGAVLEACRRIPYGRTASYADLARAAGSPGAARAAGSTMASNPLPLVVPCHRVLRSDGSLGGFSSPWGVRQKARLLRLEGSQSSAVMLGAF